MRGPTRIDFLVPSPWPMAGSALAVAAAVLLAWQGWHTYERSDGLMLQREALAGLQRRSEPRPGVMSPEDIRRHGQIESVARYLATPWEGLLQIFEAHSTARVRLSRFEPDATTGRVQISGRAANAEELGRYLTSLEADPRLQGVLLTRHEVFHDEAGRPAEFTLSAAWNTSARARPTGVGAASASPSVAAGRLP